YELVHGVPLLRWWYCSSQSSLAAAVRNAVPFGCGLRPRCVHPRASAAKLFFLSLAARTVRTPAEVIGSARDIHVALLTIQFPASYKDFSSASAGNPC
ncbi:MAG TPA: hypothetical protein VMB73_24210, partial [Acetobacteraceae bacterium]|nr:hypothetical protein [Acetobacteraceae bacterium]